MCPSIPACWDIIAHAYYMLGYGQYMYGCILCINCNSTCEYKCLSGEFNVAKASCLGLVKCVVVT